MMIQIAAEKAQIFLLFVTIFASLPVFAQPEETINHLPLSKPKLVSTLSELLTELDIPHRKQLPSIIQASQVWRRKPDQERWEVADLQLSENKKQKVMALLSRLGMTNEVIPSAKKFRYAIMLSGTAPRMRTRLQHLVKNWQAGVRFDEIIFLTSQRILDPGIDKVDDLITHSIGANKTAREKEKARPATEFEAAQLVYQSTPMPAEMRKLKIHFTSTPREWLGNRWQRKNTRQGMQEWLKTRPTAGSALIISNQPHVLYQTEVAYQEFPDVFPIQATGGEAASGQSIIHYLDALALWLHNLSFRLSH